MFVQNQQPSPSASPFLCRQRNANSRTGSDVETGRFVHSLYNDLIAFAANILLTRCSSVFFFFFNSISGSLLESAVTGQIVASPKKDNQNLSVWQTKPNSDKTNKKISGHFVELPLAASSSAALSPNSSDLKKSRMPFNFPWTNGQSKNDSKSTFVRSHSLMPTGDLQLEKLYCQCKHHIIN